MKSRKTILLAIFLCTVGYPQESISQIKDLGDHDGVDWLRDPDIYKSGFLAGLIMGASIANQELSTYGNPKDWDKSDKLTFTNWYRIKAIYKKLADLSLFEFSVGQIKDGVDALYKDFANRRIKVIDAIYIVKMEIKGESQEIINAQVRYLKMLPIASDVQNKAWENHDKYIDEKGHSPTYSEIKNGDFSYEDILRLGKVVTSDSNIHDLFCYGNYK